MEYIPLVPNSTDGVTSWQYITLKLPDNITTIEKNSLFYHTFALGNVYYGYYEHAHRIVDSNN
jgi:hypothetical protein